VWKRAGLMIQRFPGSTPGPAPSPDSSVEERRPDATEAGGSRPSRGTHGAVDELEESPAFQAGHVAGSNPVRAARSGVVQRQDRRLLTARSWFESTHRSHGGAGGHGHAVGSGVRARARRGFESLSLRAMPARPSRCGRCPYKATVAGSSPAAGTQDHARVAQRKSVCLTKARRCDTSRGYKVGAVAQRAERRTREMRVRAPHAPIAWWL
jgi:hypothetical protein